MKSYKELSYNELVAERDKLRKELVNMRMQKVLGHLDNPMSI
ncbi:MAG: 50S ribosomal protein L29 [Spirochaetales bacterium]|nr:50S ribosomal protein L29 [Candidatus Physcosoma equi]